MEDTETEIWELYSDTDTIAVIKGRRLHSYGHIKLENMTQSRMRYRDMLKGKGPGKNRGLNPVLYSGVNSIKNDAEAVEVNLEDCLKIKCFPAIVFLAIYFSLFDTAINQRHIAVY